MSYSGSDPSFNSIVHISVKPHNFCGVMGSFLADLLYQSFGLPAWVLVLSSLRQSVMSFRPKSSRGQERTHWWLDVLLLLCVTCLLSLHLGDVRFFSGQIRVGGSSATSSPKAS